MTFPAEKSSEAEKARNEIPISCATFFTEVSRECPSLADKQKKKPAFVEYYFDIILGN